MPGAEQQSVEEQTSRTGIAGIIIPLIIGIALILISFFWLIIGILHTAALVIGIILIIAGLLAIPFALAKGTMRYAILGGIVLLLLIVGIIAAGISGLFLDVLYVFLMLLAAFMIVATLLQVYSIILLIRTIISVRNEMKPLLASVQETLNIVKDTAKTAGHTVSTLGTTTQMAGDLAVAPTVKAAAAVVASRQVLRVFLGKGQARNRAEQRRQEQLEAIQEAAKANGTGGES